MSNEILQGMSTAYNRVRRVILARMLNLFELMDARRVPDAFAQELASVVGFSDELRLAGRIVTPADWRRVIQLAPTIWESKGGHETLRQMVLAFAGARSWIGDWFSFRTVAGVSVFPWIGTQSVQLNGHYWTEIHVEDVDDELDVDLVVDALNLVRPFGERFNVTFVRFVENWDNLFRWTSTNASVADNVCTVDASSGTASIVSDTDTSLWDLVTYNALVHVALGTTLSFRFRDDLAGQNYQVDITQGNGPSNVVLRRDGTSVATATHPVPGPPAKAVGSITTVAGSALVDGETFVLDDGTNPAVTFELDDDGSVGAGNIAVAFTGSDTADDVRDAIVAAVNAAANLDIAASDGGAATVSLTHDENTHVGNVLISETVADAGFVVTGMAGGIPEVGQFVSVRTEKLVGGDVVVTVAINGHTLITYTDPTPRAAGAVTWLATSGTHNVLWFEVLPANATTRVLE